MKRASAGLITQSETARLLGISPAGVAYRGKHRLGLTRHRRGRFVLYDPVEVLALAHDWASHPHPSQPRNILEHLKVLCGPDHHHH